MIQKEKAFTEECQDFVRPVVVKTVYPVIRSDGTLESTFSIETKLPESEIFTGVQKDNHDSEGVNKMTVPRQPLYDTHGIRIQYGLTAREIQVLQCLSEGASNPEISGMLNISFHTVKSHVIHIFNKLNVNDRT